MIKLPLPANAQYQLNTLTPHSPSLDLKIGQQIDADIIQISPDKKSIQLTIAQQKINVFIQTDSSKSKQQLVQLKTGDTIKLVVSKLLPQAELKILLNQQDNNTAKNTAHIPITNDKNLTLIVKSNILTTLPTAQTNKPISFNSPHTPIRQTPKNTRYTPLLTNPNNQQQLIVKPSTSTTLPTAQNNKPISFDSPQTPILLQTPKNIGYTPLLANLNNQQQLNARILEVRSKNITVQLLIPVKLDAISQTKPTNLTQLSKLPNSSSVKPSQTNNSPAISTTQTSYKTLTLNFPLPAKNTIPQQLTLTPQQSITLQVTQTGPEPQFKILPPPTTEETVNTALRELLPKELPPQVLLQQLSRDLPTIVRHEQVSETLKRLAQEILKNLPSKQQVTEGKQLKNTLDNNGTYLEAKLSQIITTPNPLKLNTDFKANLLKLIYMLQQNPISKEGDTSDNEVIKTLLKEIQSKTEGALARLMLNQLQSLPQEDSNKQVWAIDLPFTDKKEKVTSVKIQIEENNKKADDSEHKNWSATITLTPPNMQMLHCKISYLNQAIHTNFWSEHKQTTQLIQNNLDYLRQRLDQAGLTPGNMSAHQQKQSQQTEFSLDNKPLFDDNA